MDPEKKYTLKILSGLHQGAEIPLGDGQYVIGKDDACDIVLTDSAMAARHLKLHIQNGDMEIVRFDDLVSVDGEEIGQEPTALSHFQVVTIGMTHLSFGLVDEAWPDLTLPEVKCIHTPREEEETGEKIEDAPEEKEPDPPAKKSRTPESRFILMGVGGFLGMICLILLLVSVFTGTDSNQVQKPDIRLESVQEVLKAIGRDGLKVVVGDDNRVSVEGQVETREQKKEIQDALREKYPGVRVKVHSTQEMVESVQDIFNGMGFNLRARSGGPGQVVLQGYLKKPEERDRILSMVRQDLPSIRKLDNRILSRDDLDPVFTGLIKGSGLEKKIRFQAHDDYILVSGLGSREDLKQWKRLKEQFHSTHGRNITIKENFRSRVASGAGPRRLTLPIQGVSLSGIPSVIMTDGTRYFEGGKLKNGYRIISIKPDRIILGVGGQRINYRIGD